MSINNKEKTARQANIEREESISETRRDFIKKYGALAAVTPVALTLTMHSRKALASSACTECGP